LAKDFIGKLAICSMCGREKRISIQKDAWVDKNGNPHPYFLKCEDCSGLVI